MSQVNFVQQINLFMEYSRRNRLTSHDRILWFGLFYCANTWAMRAENHEWPDDYFQVSNSELEAWAGLEERAVRNSRNRLKQLGLIDFKKGDGRRSDPQYRINYLAVIRYRIVPVDVCERTVIGSNTAPDDAGGHVGDHVGEHVCDHGGDCASDLQGTGCKNVPGYVGEPYSHSQSSHVNKHKTKGGNIAPKSEITAIERESGARMRVGSYGLVDMDNGHHSVDGLISLAQNGR